MKNLITNEYTIASLTTILAISLLAVSAMAQSDTAGTTATVTVDAFLSVTLDDATLAFGTTDPLATTKPTGDPLVATIGAETNVGSIFVKTKADGTDLCTDYPTCAGSTFAVSNLEWDSTDSFPGTSYTQVDATVCSSLSASDTCNIYHELTIPAAQAAGTYSVGITVTATTTA